MIPNFKRFISYIIKPVQTERPRDQLLRSEYTTLVYTGLIHKDFPHYDFIKCRLIEESGLFRFGLDKFPVYSGLGLDRFPGNSGLGLICCTALI